MLAAACLGGVPFRPRQNRLINSSAASRTSASPVLTLVPTASPAPTNAIAIMSKSALGSGFFVPDRNNLPTRSMMRSRPSRTVCAKVWELVACVYRTIQDARLASM